MLLLTLALLFFILAVLPWQRVFRYDMGGYQVLHWRVAFAAISLSVAFGYVAAVYMNGIG